jgi:hypothetical protein
MRKLLAILAILAMAGAVALSGCSGFGVFNSKAKADIQKVETFMAPLIADVQKGLTAIQADYPFWSALAQGTLEVAGVKPANAAAITQAAFPYVTAADTDLALLGKAIAYNQNPTGSAPVTAADVQNAISSTTTALPVLKTTVLANPAVAALYQAYVAGQTNVPAPAAAAAAVPTS